MRPRDRRGFTMVELLVVTAVLMMLVGTLTTSIVAAQERAMVQKATAEIQSITQAILAYQNYGRVNDDNPLSQHTMDGPASEGAMAFILGREPLKNGMEGNIPVLYQGDVVQNALRDPWGNPYIVTIREAQVDPEDEAVGLMSSVAFPNINRLPADQR